MAAFWPRVRRLRFLRRLAFSLLATLFLLWLVIIPGGSLLYIHLLLHPALVDYNEGVSAILMGAQACQAAAPPDFQEVVLSTADGLKLKGWWRPPAPRNRAAILLLGGHAGSRGALRPEAELLARQGYGVLTLDYRACAGELSTLGYREVEELRAMTAFAQGQPGVDWLGVLGFSVGGTAAIRGAAQMPAIRAVVAEGNYASLQEDILSAPAAPLSPQWQVQRLTLLFYRLYVGVWPGQVNPLADLPRLAPRPVLLIHGEWEAARNRAADQLAACGANCELWIVPGAGHGGYRSADAAQYNAKILRFFDKASERKE